MDAMAYRSEVVGLANVVVAVGVTRFVGVMRILDGQVMVGGVAYTTIVKTGQDVDDKAPVVLSFTSEET